MFCIVANLDVYSSRVIYSSVPGSPNAVICGHFIWLFKIFKMSARHHLGYGPPGCSAFRSANRKNHNLEPNLKHELDWMTDCRDTVIWNFPKCEVSRQSVGRSSVYILTLMSQIPGQSSVSWSVINIHTYTDVTDSWSVVSQSVGHQYIYLHWCHRFLIITLGTYRATLGT